MESIEKLITKLDKLKEAKRMIEDDIFACESDINQAKREMEKQYFHYIGKKAMVETTLGQKMVAVCKTVKTNNLLKIVPYFEDLKGNRISVNSYTWD